MFGRLWVMFGGCLVNGWSTLDRFRLSSFDRFCCWLGDFIRSFLAMSELILIILNVVLDNVLKVGSKFARA